MERSVPGPAAKRPPKRAGALPEVNSRQLAAVLAIAEYRSFIAAAAHLGISQPALTLTIKRLEQTLGLPLFLRTTRQVTITAAGREFVAMAERVFNDLKLSMRSLRELTEQQRGQVIVTSLIPVRMSDVIAEYGRRFPGVEIQLREGFQDDVRDDVRSGLADFGVGDIGDLPDSHLTESLGVEELWVVLRDDHPLARLRRLLGAAGLYCERLSPIEADGEHVLAAVSRVDAALCAIVTALSAPRGTRATAVSTRRRRSILAGTAVVDRMRCTRRPTVPGCAMARPAGRRWGLIAMS